MLLSILLLPLFTLGGEIDPTEKIKVLKTQLPHKEFVLQKDMYFEVQDFADLGRSIDIKIEQNPPTPEMCWPFPSTIRIYRSHESVEVIQNHAEADIDTLTLQQIEEDRGERIDQMVQVEEGIILTTNEHLFFYHVARGPERHFYKPEKKQEISIQSLNERNEYSISKLNYDSVSKNVYLTYKDTAFKYPFQKGELSSEPVQQQSWKSVDFQQIRVFGGYVFVAALMDGVIIYEIDPKTGDLGTPYTLDVNFFLENSTDQSIYILDVSLQGKNNDILFVLDGRSGVSQIKLTKTKSGLNFSKNAEFGVIQVKQAIAFEILDQTMIVVAESRLQSLIFEYFISKNHQNWFEMTRYQLKGRVRDVDITQDFAILSGIDMHRVIQHSIYNTFKVGGGEYERFNHFYSGGLQQLDFYRNTSGHDDAVFGINENSLLIYQWQSLSPMIGCLTYGRDIEGKTIQFKTRFNTTSCPEKERLLVRNPESISSLIVCHQEQSFNIKVTAPFLTDKDKNFVVYLVIIIIFIFFTIIGVGCYCYKSYQAQIKRLLDSSKVKNQTGHIELPQKEIQKQEA